MTTPEKFKPPHQAQRVVVKGKRFVFFDVKIERGSNHRCGFLRAWIGTCKDAIGRLSLQEFGRGVCPPLRHDRAHNLFALF